MADTIVGKYKFVSSDNYDNFMKAIGVGLVKRKLANAAKPDIVITINPDGVYSLKIISTIKSSEIKFKSGEEFIQDRIDDKKLPTTITRDGNKLIEVQKDGDEAIEIIKEFENGTLTETLKAGNVVSIRVYQKYASE